MKESYNFTELKKEISNLPEKQQLKRLIKAKTEYKQNIIPSIVTFDLEVPFDQKCDLEIQKIKELMKIDGL